MAHESYGPFDAAGAADAGVSACAQCGRADIGLVTHVSEYTEGCFICDVCSRPYATAGGCTTVTVAAMCAGAAKGWGGWVAWRRSKRTDEAPSVMLTAPGRPF